MEGQKDKQYIIGLSGKIGAGKDTAAALIQKHYEQFTKLAFAENIKKIVALLTGTTFEENMDREKRKKKIDAFDATLGQLQQKVGNGMRDAVGKNVWVNAVISEPSKYKIVTDVRFPDEVKAIEAAGGIVIRINRTVDQSAPEFVNDLRPRDDITETALDDYHFDFIVDNNGTLEDFEKHLLRIIKVYAIFF